MPIDLSHRHRQPEIMDAANLPASLFVDTLKGLGRVNAVTRSSRIMWPDLKAAAMRHPDRPIRVLDVACGGGDVLLALWRLACRAGLKVELEGDASEVPQRHLGHAKLDLEANHVAWRPGTREGCAGW